MLWETSSLPLPSHLERLVRKGRSRHAIVWYSGLVCQPHRWLRYPPQQHWIYADGRSSACCLKQWRNSTWSGPPCGTRAQQVGRVVPPAWLLTLSCGLLRWRPNPSATRWGVWLCWTATWLTLKDIKDAEKAVLLNAPVNPSGLFTRWCPLRSASPTLKNDREWLNISHQSVPKPLFLFRSRSLSMQRSSSRQLPVRPKDSWPKRHPLTKRQGPHLSEKLSQLLSLEEETTVWDSLFPSQNNS